MWSTIGNFISTSSYTTLIALIVIPLILYYWCFVGGRENYWKKNKLVYFPGFPIIGNLWEVLTFKKSYYEQVYEYYFDDSVKSEAIFGYNIFTKKAVFIREPELIKNVLIRDFNQFSNRHTTSDVHTDIMGAANLFFLKNPMWRDMRKRLTPIFSAVRLKKMFYLVNEIGVSLQSYLLNMNLNGTIIEFKELASRYTIDIIASCAFGVHANSMRTPSCYFRAAGRSVFDFTMHRAIEFTCFFTVPELVPIFKFMLFPKKMQIFLRQSINDIMSVREKSGTIRNDLIDALVQLKKEDVDKKSTETELVFQGDVLVAQAAIFFAAGFETSSSLMAFTLYEMSRHIDIQDRLRAEIKEHRDSNDGELTFEIVNKMEYLHMVVSETLRLYPTLPYLDRMCEVDDYSIDPYHTYKIPKGMPVLIPIFAIQRDPKYYPNPLDYNPERFSPENRANIVPYTYMPFGLGPHSCIGEQLGLLQSKVGIINILTNHYVRPDEDQPCPRKFYKKAFILQYEGGIPLKIYKDKD